MCGMLIPLVKSQIFPYANLWNNIILNERFNHLKFNEFYKQIFPKEEEKKYPSHRVFSSPLYEECELYSPSKKYKLPNAELKMLKETYAAIFNKNSKTIENISPNVTKFGKLRTNDRHIITSKMISKDKIKSRNNYSVLVSIITIYL